MHSVGRIAGILDDPDPLFEISFRHVFWMSGAVEAIVAATCFLGKTQEYAPFLVAWLATDFMLYRIALLVIGCHRPCHWLGNLTDALHISPQAADTAMRVVLAYFLVGGYATLFWLWRQKRKMLSSKHKMKQDGLSI
jgi:hypothetical protein